MTDHVPPQLCNLLKTYQCTATKSLQGPGLSMVHSHKKEILSPSELIDDPPLCPPPQPPQLSQPILTAPDTQRSILYETILEGKPIACFLIGGEMRLCVPQILNTILTVYKLDQIYKCCDELQISFSECTDEQLSEFKAAKILPENIKGSGLITRTNAERLCSALLHRPDVRRIIKGSGSFRVYHKCFGRCEGVCTPDLYSYKEQACIECLVCHGMFSPQRFVCHAHANRETQVCHWGFDSNNWRAYLHVSLDEDSMDKYTNMLDELSERESQKVTNYFVGPREGCNLKKKAPIDEPHIQITCKTEPIDIPAKKSKRVDDATSYLIDYHHQYQALMYAQYRQQQISAFRPWAQTAATITQQAAAAASGGQSLKHLTHIPYAGIPYLSQEPPVLQHPERVVPLSDCERFERSYQPNVALAPRKPNHISVKERDKDRGTNTINNTNNTINNNNNNSNINNNTNRVIQMTDIQIKQERPSTPTPPATLQPSISITALHQTASNAINSPIELRISSSPNTNPNTTNGPDHSLTNGSTSIVPQPSFSPETLSGSNEITSSTSPVLINIKTDVDCARSPVPIELHQTKIELRSPTIHHHHHHNHQHHNSIILKNANNGNNTIRANTISGNSEFELSTDTDDDSLNGEPDSSNTNLPLEIASDIMKNCRPDEREKIIHLIRCLLQENSQLRHFVIDNQNELRRRDEQINELLQQQHDLEEQIRRSAAASLMVQQISSPNLETTTGSVIQAKIENIGTLSQMDQTATTITRCLSPRKPIRLNHQTEVIMKPLKKLLRRSPIDEMNASSAGVVVIKKNDMCNNRIGVVVSGSETTKLSISSQSPLLSSTGGGNNGSSTALSSTSSTTSSLSSPTASESNINLNNSNTSITRICSNNINNINNNSSVSKTDDCNSNNNNSCSNKNNLKDNDHDHNDCDRNNTSPDSG